MTWVLITGATAGIGRATALELARRGLRVVATGRRPDALGALEAQARADGPGLVTARLDVTDPASVAAAAREVDQLTGGHGVDVLIHNAGYGEKGPVELLDGARAEAMFETNVIGVARVTRAFVPRMRERGRGRVVAISSLLGRMTLPTHGVYGATKHALEALGDALRRELATRGVDVVIVEPGSVATGFDALAFGALEALDADADWRPVLEHVRGLARVNARTAATPEAVAATIADAAMGETGPRLAAPRIASLQLTASRRAPAAVREAALRGAFGLPLAPPPAAPEPAPRRAVVTGAAGGIGRATAERLAKAGYRVVATDRDPEALARLRRAVDEQRLPVETRRMDVTDEAQIRAVAEDVGPVDVLVNNAGYAEVGPIELATDDAWRAQLAVNVHGVLATVRAFGPAMRAARRGRIVNVSSVVGVVALPYLGVYAASKHAVEAITDATRLELGAFGVGVSAVQPAFVRSGFAETAKATLARYDMESSPYAREARRMDRIIDRLDRLGGEPSDVARAIHRAIAAPAPAPRYRTPLSAILAARVAPWLGARATDRALSRLFA